MPRKRSFEKQSIVEQQRVPSREEFFALIGPQLKQINTDDWWKVLGVLRRVFEHNITDALDLCEEFGVGSENIGAALLRNQRMVVKHSGFVRLLESRLKDIALRVPNHLRNEPRYELEMAEAYREDPLIYPELPTNETSEKLLAVVDAYYAQQLSLRTFRAPESENQSEPSVDAAEMVVRDYISAYNREVHRNQVFTLLVNVLGRHAPAKDALEREFQIEEYLRVALPEDVQLLLLAQEYISPADMERVLDALPEIHTDARRAFMKEFAEHRYRPLSPVMEAAQLAARSGMPKTSNDHPAQESVPALLTKKIRARGAADNAFELVRDPISHTYEVKWKSQEIQKPQKQIEMVEFGKDFDLFHGDFRGATITAYGMMDEYSGDTNDYVHALDFLFNERFDGAFSATAQFKGKSYKCLASSESYPTAVCQDDQGVWVVHAIVSSGIARKRLISSYRKIVAVTGEDNLLIFFEDGGSGWVNGETGEYYRRPSAFERCDLSTGIFYNQDNIKITYKNGNQNCEFKLNKPYERVICFRENQLGTVLMTAGVSEFFIYCADKCYRVEAARTPRFVDTGDDLFFSYGDYRGVGNDPRTLLMSIKTGKILVLEGHEQEDSMGVSSLHTLPSAGVSKDGKYAIGISDHGGLFRMPLGDPVYFEVLSDRPSAMRLGVSYIKNTTQVRATISNISHMVDIYVAEIDSWSPSVQIKLKPSVNSYFLSLREVGNAIILYALEVNEDGTIIEEKPVYVVRINTLTESSNPELTKDEQYLLDVLNTSQQPTREHVEEFVKKYPDERVDLSDAEKKKKQGERLVRMPEFIVRLNDVVKQAAHNLPLAKSLFKTMAASQSGLDAALVGRAIDLMFPTLAIELAQQQRGKQNSISSSEDGPRALHRQESASFDGGDPQQKHSRELLKMREPLSAFLPNGIFTEYSADAHEWRPPHQEILLASDARTLTHETTCVIKLVGDADTYTLLMPLGAELISARVKMFDGGGREMDQAPKISRKHGLWCVTVPRGVMSVSYSYKYAVGGFVPTAGTDREYEQFRGEWTQGRSRARAQVGKKSQIELPIAVLPPECRLFIRGIERDPPHVRIQKIEQYVRDISYYDFDNNEVRHAKSNKTVTERLSLMRSRMAQLRVRKPEIAALLSKKIFAGVCADVSELTAVLLQASGFVSGVMSGIRLEGTSATADNVHAIGFVAWSADQRGECRIVEVDGTPGGVTPHEQELLAHIQRPSLAQRAADVVHAEEDFARTHAAEFERIVHALAGKNPDEIKAMTNGMIESAVNAVLSHEAQHGDAQVIEHVANVLLYSPVSLHRVDWKNPQQKIEVLRFVDEELTRERSLYTQVDRGKKPGARILDAMVEFVEKYRRRYPDAAVSEPLDVLERVYDGLQGHLQPVEYRAALVVITYLRAKKMSR